MTRLRADGVGPMPRVIVFAREPRLGEVKSRLAATLGAEVALQTHRELLDATLAAVRACPGVDRWLCLAAGSGSRSRTSGMAPAGFQLSWQGAGDLGARMAAALRASAGAGVPTVLVGCDCPPLDASVIGSALAALEDADFVLGPTEDGGYALIGARVDRPTVFEGVDWGTPRVMAQTRERLAQSGSAWRELPLLWDVDDEADWRRWQDWRAHRRAAGA